MLFPSLEELGIEAAKLVPPKDVDSRRQSSREETPGPLLSASLWDDPENWKPEKQFCATFADREHPWVGILDKYKRPSAAEQEALLSPVRFILVDCAAWNSLTTLMGSLKGAAQSHWRDMMTATDPGLANRLKNFDRLENHAASYNAGEFGKNWKAKKIGDSNVSPPSGDWPFVGILNKNTPERDYTTRGDYYGAGYTKNEAEKKITGQNDRDRNRPGPAEIVKNLDPDTMKMWAQHFSAFVAAGVKKRENWGIGGEERYGGEERAKFAAADFFAHKDEVEPEKRKIESMGG